MKTLIIGFVCGLAASVLSGCRDIKAGVSSSPSDLLIAEDRERGVVCYRFRHFEGVSCVQVKAGIK